MSIIASIVVASFLAGHCIGWIRMKRRALWKVWMIRGEINRGCGVQFMLEQIDDVSVFDKVERIEV